MDMGDEDIIDFVSYQSVQHAFDTCGKFQLNICSTDLWMHHMGRNNCTVCMLDDTLNDTELRSANAYLTLDKFIVCTDNPDHKFVADVSVDETTVFDLHTGLIPPVNSVLVDPLRISHHRYIVCSQSLLPYVLSRML